MLHIENIPVKIMFNLELIKSYSNKTKKIDNTQKIDKSLYIFSRHKFFSKAH
jgi:hypothetical protein